MNPLILRLPITFEAAGGEPVEDHREDIEATTREQRIAERLLAVPALQTV